MNTIRLNTIGEVFAKSGGQQGGGESASNVEYLDVSGDDAINTFVKPLSIKARGWIEGSSLVIFPTSYFYYAKSDMDYNMPQYIEAVEIDFNAKVVNEGVIMTLQEYFTSQGIDPASLPRITKEQFYNLEA